MALVGGRAILLLRNPWLSILSTWHHQLTNSWDGEDKIAYEVNSPRSIVMGNKKQFRK